VGGSTSGAGEGRSKKEAEQHAAEAAWNAIREMVVAREAGANGSAPGKSGASGASGASGKQGKGSGGDGKAGASADA
jgi:ribonuclease-3